MTPQQVLAEARKLDAVVETQKWVTALMDALLAVPYKGPLSCSRAASDYAV